MSTTRLALDAMGGDNAPAIVIKGADVAKAKNPDLEFVFVGDSERIKPYLSRSIHLKDASVFAKLMRLLAGRVGQEINYQSPEKKCMQI